ncbi:hypothetical protein EDD17DRAFT_1526668 [Pisolithus thermaeus]|nr:hypothetical protein EDD17DRAFT_1526668 [Pisolithus thermaeus]
MILHLFRSLSALSTLFDFVHAHGNSSRPAVLHVLCVTSIGTCFKLPLSWGYFEIFKPTFAIQSRASKGQLSDFVVLFFFPNVFWGLVKDLGQVNMSFLCLLDSLVLLFLGVIEFVTLMEAFQCFLSFGNSLCVRRFSSSSQVNLLFSLAFPEIS